eukprot:1892437-Rhodomonas_salina.3
MQRSIPSAPARGAGNRRQPRTAPAPWKHDTLGQHQPRRSRGMASRVGTGAAVQIWLTQASPLCLAWEERDAAACSVPKRGQTIGGRQQFRRQHFK